MAVTQTQTLPAPFLTDVTKDYAKRLGQVTAPAMDTSKFAPTVAAQDPAQTQAYNLGQAGVGAYQPYITQAGAYSGPTAYQSFMSPYQQDIIDTTMADFDKQAAQQLSGIGQLAAQSGNLGGGREGVMRSEYMTQSDRNRAAMLAQLRQQMFGQAQAAAGQGFQQQMQMGQQLPAWQAGDISQLGQLGGIQQAQAQAEADAQREANRMTAMEPYERMGIYGSGITGLISGYPGQYQTSVVPNPTPLQTALGTGAVLGGIYGNLRGNTQNAANPATSLAAQYLPLLNRTTQVQ